MKIAVIFIIVYSMLPLLYGQSFSVYAQSDLQTFKTRNLVIDLGNGTTTNAQLTYPAIGNGSYPAVLLITGSGAEDMNETGGYIHIDKNTEDISINTFLSDISVSIGKRICCPSI